MQKLIIIGNVGKDASIKNANGKEFLSFTVAVNTSYKNTEGVKIETTNWYNVISSQISICKYLLSGTLLYVDGTPKYSIFKNKNGENQISLDLKANNIKILSSKKEDLK